MSGPRYPGFDTLSLHAGQRPDAAFGSRAVPIYQTVSFVFEDSDIAASRFDIARSGHVYSRISNPTTAVLEERLAALEKGVGAVATASGMAAMLHDEMTVYVTVEACNNAGLCVQRFSDGFMVDGSVPVVVRRCRCVFCARVVI